ncbi:MAG: alkaline phosphatase [Sphingobacteriales bacterium]|nr:MAG: alkaline phosphatase [Sphingobacteriales bacterium]
MFPTVYSLLRKSMPSAEIGVIYEWDGIGHLFPKAAVNMDKNCDGDSNLAKEVTDYIKQKRPTFLFAHFHDVDSVGHTVGHDTPEYYAAIERTDKYIGDVIQSVRDAGIANETVIIFTADHGGINKGHGAISMQEMEIPWIIIGPGIKAGNQIKESIMTFDTAATIAKILELTPPQVWIGRPVNAAFANRK